MQNEAQLARERQRAAQARTLIENPLWKEAFAYLNDSILARWRETPARDTDGREALWMMHRQLYRLGGYFAQIAETGRLAEITLEGDQK